MTTGSLVKMKITAYSDCDFDSDVGSYDTMLNPASIKWDRSNNYNTSKVPDNGFPSPKYNNSSAQTLSFDLVIDCTGVVDSARVNLATEINQLRGLVYDYVSATHRPNFVQIDWSDSFTFKGVLTNFDVEYSYFKPDGTALRAKIALKFLSYLDPARVAKQENKQSPDMTHLVEVVAGDSLPQLAKKIYHSTDYTVQLAEFNQLDKFRYLPPGTALVFPPVVSGTAPLKGAQQ